MLCSGAETVIGKRRENAGTCSECFHTFGHLRHNRSEQRMRVFCFYPYERYRRKGGLVRAFKIAKGLSEIQQNTKKEQENDCDSAITTGLRKKPFTTRVVHG